MGCNDISKGSYNCCSAMRGGILVLYPMSCIGGDLPQATGRTGSLAAKFRVKV